MLNIADKLIRYKNHIAFINSYIKAKKIPKGFKLKFHNNLDLNVEPILQKCSLKIMKQTMSFYKTEIKSFFKSMMALDEKVRLQYPEQHIELINRIEVKAERINNQMATRQKEKMIRDKMDLKNAEKNIAKMKQRIEEVLSECKSKEYTTEDLTQGVNIPSHEPILLTENPTYQENSFKSLLSKGPSFVPTPSFANWDDLQKDFEQFANCIRREIFFHNSGIQASMEKRTDVPRKPSNWKPPKANIPEAEIFLKQIEKYLFVDVQPKRIKSNLTKEERTALQECKKMLNNPQSKEVIRMQDKVNKFIIVEKETDIIKAEKQIKILHGTS